MQPVQAITRKAQWAEEDAALSKFHADKRAAMGPGDLVAPELSKPRPPQRSLLTARFSDLADHPAFQSKFNAYLVLLGMGVAERKHRGMVK